MDQVQIIIPKSSSQILTKSIGDNKIAQFVDLNHEIANYRRTQSVESRICSDGIDYIEKIIKFQEKYLGIVGPTQAKIDLHPLLDLRNVDKVYDPFQGESKPVELRKIQETKLNHLTDQDTAFTVTKTELDSLELQMKAFEVLKGLTTRKRENTGVSTLSMVSGVLLRKDQQKFQKTILRLSRGNAAIYFKELNSEVYNEQQIFVILVVGQEGGILHSRCMKAAATFDRARIQDIPEQEEEQTTAFQKKQEELEQKRMIYNKSINMILLELRECTKNSFSVEVSQILVDLAFLQMQKGIQDTMNKQTVRGSTLVAECWVPQIYTKDLHELVEFKNQGNLHQHITSKMVQGEMKVLTMNVEVHRMVELSPPTFFRQNNISKPFQLLTDTQGVPRYKELNPTLFNCISFPFEFGIMFGDIFHGSFMLIIGLILIAFDSRIKAGPVRQAIAQMGFWATFMGFIYNDYTGLTLDLFGSCQHQVGNTFVRNQDTCVQTFGMDPVWGHTDGEIAQQNSFKMKFAVLIGVVQMCFGILLKGLNNIYQKQWVDFYFEFIPQIIFMVCLFGWMCILILVKWFVQGTDASGLNPNLITTMINMVLSLGKADIETKIMVNANAQSGLQCFLVVVALLCIPTMLLVKPIYLSNHHEHPLVVNSIQPLVKEQKGHGLAELLLHQMIETIEFVLGSVSNTASYLRLWALSLAHSQLASVFFNQLFKSSLNSNFFAIAVAFVIFMSVTIGVLMLMDSVECVLHALRLHWVEFQNKFYKADGKKFMPYNHRHIIGLDNELM